jgi:hypothetical protein
MVFLWMRMTRHRGKEKCSPTEVYSKSELHRESIDRSKIVNEANAGEILELPAESQPVEIQ